MERNADAADDADRVWMLRMLGPLDEARDAGERALAAASDRWRPLLLLADVERDAGDRQRAAALQGEALGLATTPHRRATTQQHIGKRRFVEGDLLGAADSFERALAIRREIGADPALIESSRIAVERARRDLGIAD